MYIIVHGNSMKGFTIIETLIAVTILMLVTTGVIFALGNSLRTTVGSDVRIQAELLAEEGTELVRAIKDSNLLQQKLFYLTINTCTASVPCYVVNDGAALPELKPCSGTCPALKISALGYGHQAAATTASPFTRTITVDTLNTDSNGRPSEIRVNSTVTYQERGSTQSVAAKAIFTNWYE